MPIPEVSPATITALRRSIPTLRCFSFAFHCFSPNREKEGRTTKMSPKNLQPPRKKLQNRGTLLPRRVAVWVAACGRLNALSQVVWTAAVNTRIQAARHCSGTSIEKHTDTNTEKYSHTNTNDGRHLKAPIAPLRGVNGFVGNKNSNYKIIYHQHKWLTDRVFFIAPPSKQPPHQKNKVLTREQAWSRIARLSVICQHDKMASCTRI